MHFVKSVQIRSFFWSAFSRIRTEYREILRENAGNAGKYGPEITSYLDTFHAVIIHFIGLDIFFDLLLTCDVALFITTL